MSIKKLWFAGLAATFLLPAVAWAQEMMPGEMEEEEEAEEIEVPWSTQQAITYTSQLELGILYSSEDSFKFGEFTGLEDEGPYAIGNADIDLRPPYDSDSAYFFRLTGRDLGLDSRFVEMKGGYQGLAKGYIGYDQIPKFITDSARTPFIGATGTNLALPNGWDPGPNTTGMNNLIANLREVEIDHDRKRIFGGFTVNPAPHWQVKADYRHEIKEGSRIIGAIIGNTGGNPRAALVPEPIDYTTEQLDVAVSYTTRKFQAEVAYFLSLFNNDDTSLTWRNPFTEPDPGDPEWAAGVGFPTGQGRLGLPPDNQFHQVTFTGGYNITPTTRAVLDLSHGWMLQDETFLPYTVNSLLTVTEPLPRSSLDGEIETTLINLKLDSRPAAIPKLHARAGFRWDDRDNDTPQDEFIYIGGDSQDQDTAADSSRRRTNLPISYTQTNVTADADYEVYTRTEAGVGYEYERVDRKFREVAETTEHIGKLRLKTKPHQRVSVGIDGSYGIKDGSEYRFDFPFQATSSIEHWAEEFPDRWENHPLLRKFDEADRDRARLKGAVTVTPTSYLSLGLAGSYMHDDFDDTIFGLKERKINNMSFDVSYLAAKDVSMYGYYSFENIESDQAGRQFQGFAKFAHSRDPRRNWFIEHDDEVHTAGLGVRVDNVIKDRLDVGADYVYSMAHSEFAFSQGPSLASAPIPDLESTFHRFTVFGTYNIRKDLTAKLSYGYETYETFDWGLDNVRPNTLANVITLGNISPDYAVHLVGASMIYRF